MFSANHYYFFGVCTDKNIARHFFVCLAMTAFCYSYTAINMLIGNHDISWLGSSLSLFPSNILNGWLVGHYLNVVLAYGKLMPIVPYFFVFCAMSLTGLVFFKVFRGKTHPASLEEILSSLIMCLFTPFMSIFFYTYQMLNFAYAVLFMALGFWGAADSRYSVNILGSLFVAAALLSYEASLSIIGVLCSLWLFDRVLRSCWHEGDIYRMMIGIARISFFLLLGVLIFMVVNKLMIYGGFVSESTYRFHHYSLSDFIRYFSKNLYQAFNHLFITQPFMPREVKILLCIVIFSGFMCSLVKVIKKEGAVFSKAITSFLLLFFLCWAIVFCKTPQFLNPVSSGEPYEYRFFIYGMPFILCYFSYICIGSFKKIRTISVLVVSSLLVLMFYNNIYAQYVWKTGFEKEILLYTRVVERILTDKNYDQSIKYTYLQMGIKNFRVSLYKEKYDFAARELLNYPMQAHWVPQELLKFIEPDINIVDAYDTENWGGMKKAISDSLPIRKKYIDVLNAMEPWPSKKSVAIVDNYIFVAIDKKALERYKDITK